MIKRSHALALSPAFARASFLFRLSSSLGLFAIKIQISPRRVFMLDVSATAAVRGVALGFVPRHLPPRAPILFIVIARPRFVSYSRLRSARRYRRRERISLSSPFANEIGQLALSYDVYFFSWNELLFNPTSSTRLPSCSVHLVITPFISRSSPSCTIQLHIGPRLQKSSRASFSRRPGNLR